MTDHETLEHRRATRTGRRFAVVSITIAVLVVLGSLGNLYRVQASNQDCLTDFLAYDSQARDIRTAASAESQKATRAAFDAAAMLIDPAAQPTAEDVETARELFIESGSKADAYEAKVADYPYQDFKKECG